MSILEFSNIYGHVIGLELANSVYRGQFLGQFLAGIVLRVVKMLISTSPTNRVQEVIDFCFVWGLKVESLRCSPNSAEFIIAKKSILLRNISRTLRPLTELKNYSKTIKFDVSPSD